jgi:hypothetical protein
MLGAHKKTGPEGPFSFCAVRCVRSGHRLGRLDVFVDLGYRGVDADLPDVRIGLQLQFGVFAAFVMIAARSSAVSCSSCWPIAVPDRLGVALDY